MFKTFTVIVALVLSPTPALADWKPLATGTIRDGITGFLAYYDPDRIVSENGHIYVWLLANIYPERDGHASLAQYYQVDCRLVRFRRLELYSYPERMAKGRETKLHDPLKWLHPSPGSTLDHLKEQVC